MPVPKRQYGVELRFHPRFLQHLSRRRVREVLAGIDKTFHALGSDVNKNQIGREGRGVYMLPSLLKGGLVARADEKWRQG